MKRLELILPNQIRKFSFVSIAGIILIAVIGWWLSANQPEITNVDSSKIYEQRVNHSPDGIGKYYMGREIAKVMGHTGAGWLERPSRELEEQLVFNMGIKGNWGDKGDKGDRGERYL